MEMHDHNKTGCDGGCPTCNQDGTDGLPPGALTGWKLVGTVGGAFLLPLGLAILGAILAGTETDRQVVGGLIGLLAGLAVAILASAVLARAGRDHARRRTHMENSSP
jgi:chromate transport protein ChrA